MSPLALACAIGFTAAIALADDRIVLLALGMAAVAAFGAAGWAPASWLVWAPLGALLAGLHAVSGRDGPRWLGVAIATASGGAIGVAAELDERTWGAALGVSVALLLVASAGIEGLLWLHRQPRWQLLAAIGRRVLGAWVAAIGVLLGALAVFGLR